MLKKILVFMARLILGVVLFYLFISFVVIPVGLSWAIKDRGTKILRHPVSVRAVQFNPFLLKLSLYDLKIQDADGTVMAGFGRFSVDVSFCDLFKKVYRIEDVVLGGLEVNAVLSPDGSVNLLGLVPPVNDTGSGGLSVAAEPPDQKVAPSALPLVVVDRIMLDRGKILFTDKMVQPNFVTGMSDMNLQVTGLTTRPEDAAKVVFGAMIDGKGRVSTETTIRPFEQPLELETVFSLDGYPLVMIGPYTGKYTGRAMKDGRLDLKMDYRISDNQLTATHKVLIQSFEFGKKVESKDALSLPFGLAIALLEDPQGRIKISLPVSGDMSRPDFHYWELVGQVARNFFMTLVTKPFTFLASLLGAEGGTEEMGRVRFSPGRADLLAPEKEKLDLFVRGLKERPKLRLEVNGGYDLVSDWKAIKVEALRREYEELRSQSSKSDSWIYQMLYQRRFGIRDLWALTKKYKVKEGSYQDEVLVAEVKRQLIENAPPDKASLEALAAQRAKAVYDYLTQAGLDDAQVSLGISHQVQASMGFVPVEFTLTVFGDEQDKSEGVQKEE